MNRIARLFAILILPLAIAACQTTVPSLPATNHPRLPDPPIVVVDALETVSRTDADAANWTIDLDNFLRKQDVE